MFTRKSFKDQNKTSSNQNYKSDELFDYIQQRNIENIREYLSNPDYKVWQVKDNNGYTILHKSVFNNDYEITSVIIQEVKKRLGMNKDSLPKFINEKTNDGLTALHYAAYKGNIKLFELLKQNGASVDDVTNLGKNIMHMAAEGNQPSMMIYLISKEHQSTTTIDENGSTPLHWACYSGAEEAVNFLLNFGVDINAQDNQKLTPLHLAVVCDKDKIVLKLLQRNADKNIKDYKGKLAIDTARKKNRKKIIFLLEDDEDYNPYCSLETPKNYVQPNDIYKKFILLMILIPEVIIYFLILPYLKGTIETLINVPLFILCLFTYFIFIAKNPGFKHNSQLEREARGRGKYPLMLKVDEGVDIRNYCPKCFIQKSNNVRHCFICDKCVEDFNHHCFWINKCIGKDNKFIYFLFILFSLIYANHTLFICFELLLDNVNLPYDQKYLHFYFFKKERGLRVLGASSVAVFSFVVGMPLWFLLLIEILKTFGVYGKKTNEDNLENLVKKASKEKVNLQVELQGKGEALLPEDEKEENIVENNNINEDGPKNNIINTSFSINEDGPKNNLIDNANDDSQNLIKNEE